MVRKKDEGTKEENMYDVLGKKILKLNKSILSLTINDEKGDVLGKAFTAEYERKYMESAKDLRARAGLFSALIFGIAAEPEKIFGETKAIVRMYADVKLILVPFANRKMMATLLTKNRVDSDDLIKSVRPLLHSP